MRIGRPIDRWRARPVLASGLRVILFLAPIACSLGVAEAGRRVLPPPPGGPERLLWWGLLLALGVGTAVGVERVGRRFIPLIVLFRLSMLFPDRAPSRFAVARQAGSVRRLRARLEEVNGDPRAREEAASAGTILALATALQSHDRRTRGHAERVRVYTDLLGEELQLSPEDRYRLRWAALLHDIGKLTVSGEVLNKPGKLNEDEWALIRQHPVEGARISAPLMGWLGPWAGAIADHHERFDGGGYPAGLSGPAISLAGRIVSVADAYDTMTAARSYRKPMAVAAARRELARCAGSQFDPTVVRAFLSISLPRLLWKTGPLSFLAQLPFLARLQQVGQHVATAAQGVTVATAVAGIAAFGAAGPGELSALALPSLGTGRTAAVAARHPVSPSPSPSPDPGGGRPGAPSPGTAPRPSPRPPRRPPPTAAPSPDPAPNPTPSPSPSPSDPLPLPSPSELPPLPSPSELPLPSPSDLLPSGPSVEDLSDLD